MSGSSLLSVSEAAGVLGLTPVAVRRRIETGSLPAEKIGRQWLLDRGDVERSARQVLGAGRVLSAPMAWAVLLLASGEPERAVVLAGRERYWSRAQAWLRQHSLLDYAPRLRRRAEVETFGAHPSEFTRLLARPDVFATGLSAGETVGLVGGAEGVELYAPAGSSKKLITRHGMEPGRGQVRVRWVPDEVWEMLVADGRQEAPRAAVLLDLLESDDPRARREASKALSR